MSMLNYHPAPGLGDMAPGFFAVPQNPIRPDSTVLVPSAMVAAGNRVIKKPSVGDFVASKFSVPQNPLQRQLAQGMGILRGMGCGCGCESGPPAVALGSFTPAVIDVPGGNPFRYDWPNPQYYELPWGPISMYMEPTTEDMYSYGMAGLGSLSMDGTGLLGTGLFSGGMDVSTWGAPEYVVAALGAYALLATVSTGKRHASSVRRKVSAAARA